MLVVLIHSLNRLLKHRIVTPSTVCDGLGTMPRLLHCHRMSLDLPIPPILLILRVPLCLGVIYVCYIVVTM